MKNVILIVFPVLAACGEFRLANKAVLKYSLVLWSCRRTFSLLGYRLNKTWCFSPAEEGWISLTTTGYLLSYFPSSSLNLCRSHLDFILHCLGWLYVLSQFTCMSIMKKYAVGNKTYYVVLYNCYVFVCLLYF